MDLASAGRSWLERAWGLARSVAPPRARDDPRQRVWAAGTAYPPLEAKSWGERMPADALVVNLLDLGAPVVGVDVAVGRGRNGSADAGQGGPVRIRGGSITERWRSGPVRSLMAAVLRRAGPADGAGRDVDCRALGTWASTASSSRAALVSMAGQTAAAAIVGSEASYRTGPVLVYS
jgi:hypothetical protein